MASTEFTDILITDRDLTLDVAGIPVNIDNRQVIAQDLKHAIMESGILVELIAERSPMQWARNMVKLAELAEDDQRIVPGSVIVERDDRQPGRIYIFAKTTLGTIGLTGTASDNRTTLEVNA